MLRHSPLIANAAAAAAAVPAAVDIAFPFPTVVTVNAYTESLCIGCQEFLKTELIPVYKKLGRDKVIDLHLVPFGNAHIDEDNEVVECQHGEAECDANTWEQCGVHLYEPNVYVDYIDCLESSLEMGYREEPFDRSIFENCAVTAEMDFKRLEDCHDNPMQRWILQKKYAHLTPDHEYVPWIVIDEDFFDPENQDFLEEVCKAYAAKGGSSEACAGVVTVPELN